MRQRERRLQVKQRLGLREGFVEPAGAEQRCCDVGHHHRGERVKVVGPSLGGERLVVPPQRREKEPVGVEGLGALRSQLNRGVERTFRGGPVEVHHELQARVHAMRLPERWIERQRTVDGLARSDLRLTLRDVARAMTDAEDRD